jgi:hypothetical protein
MWIALVISGLLAALFVWSLWGDLDDDLDEWEEEVMK